MARLIIKTGGVETQVVELRIGINRMGRSPENDFQIEHPTISGRHCEVELKGEQVVVRDCGSTNGTFVAGKPIKEATLSVGQSFSMGDVQLLVDSIDMKVAIPEFEIPTEVSAPPPVVKLNINGQMGVGCARHPGNPVTYRCTHCGEVLCDACVHHLQRRGGRALALCPRCSHECEPFGQNKKPKKDNFFQILAKTVKLSFAHQPSDEDN
jgi:hypothetical protein